METLPYEPSAVPADALSTITIEAFCGQNLGDPSCPMSVLERILRANHQETISVLILFHFSPWRILLTAVLLGQMPLLAQSQGLLSPLVTQMLRRMPLKIPSWRLRSLLSRSPQRRNLRRPMARQKEITKVTLIC